MNSGFQNYVELNHADKLELVRNTYAVIDKVKIKRDRRFTCPTNTLALFAHNHQFPIYKNESPEFVNLVSSSCRTRQDVEMLVRDASLPPIVTGDMQKTSSQNMPVSIADIICFDT